MQEWLNHPAMQSGLAPFLLALLTAELLQRLRLSGLAIIAGFAVTIHLVSNFSIDPLTATRKIVWLGIVASVAGVAIHFLEWPMWRPLLSSMAAGAVVWVGWPIFGHQPFSIALQWAAGCALYAAWLMYWMDGLQHDSVRAGSAGVALGLGTGLSALLGGSALLGQFGLALGAAAGAYLLIQMISNSRLPCGRSYTLPLALIAASSGGVAVLTTQLPWYALAPLAVIPLVARIPVSEKLALWVQSLLLSVVTWTGTAAAVYLTWRVAGAPPF